LAHVDFLADPCRVYFVGDMDHAGIALALAKARACLALAIMRCPAVGFFLVMVRTPTVSISKGSKYGLELVSFCL